MPVAGFEPRSMITQVFQIGVEPRLTPGTGGSATQILGTFNTQIAPVGSGAFGVFRPSGGKYVGQIVPTDIYAEGAYTDTIDFNTVTYLFAGNSGWAAGTGTPAAGVVWDLSPVPFGQGTQRTFICEEGTAETPRGSGSNGAIYRYNNAVMPDLALRFMRTGASQATGRIIAKNLGTADHFAAAGAVVHGRSISPTKIGVWSAADMATLHTGGLHIAPVPLDLSWRNNGIFAPWFAMDDTIVSFAGILEEAADAGVQITIMADVLADGSDIAGDFNFGNMTSGQDLYIKVVVVGLVITGTVHESLEIDMHLQISGPPRRANVGSVRVWQWDCLMTPDQGTGLPFHVYLTNRLDPLLNLQAS